MNPTQEKINILVQRYVEQVELLCKSKFNSLIQNPEAAQINLEQYEKSIEALKKHLALEIAELTK